MPAPCQPNSLPGVTGSGSKAAWAAAPTRYAAIQLSGDLDEQAAVRRVRRRVRGRKRLRLRRDERRGAGEEGRDEDAEEEDGEEEGPQGKERNEEGRDQEVTRLFRKK